MKPDDELPSVLARTPLFASLDAEALGLLASICSRRHCDAQQRLFTEGERGNEMFIVLSGRVKCHVESQDGEMIFSSLGPGGVFGEIALLSGDTRTSSATAVEASELLCIQRQDFDRFLAHTPAFAVALLREVAGRLRRTDQLVSVYPSRPSPQGPPSRAAAFEEAAPYDYAATLVGYGRYASLHIGPKYAKSGYPWRVKAIVDPSMDSPRFRVTVLGQAQPDTPLFLSFEEWRERYFAPLSDEEKQRQVVEIALRPDVVCAATMKYIEAGVKNLILPKPVVMNQDELDGLTEAVARHQVKAAVASQWHYSDFPKIIRREILRLAGAEGQALARTPLHRVDMEFSKENGISISATPPLSELPHVLQLLASIGLVDYRKHDATKVTGDEVEVALDYYPENIREGIHLRASLDWTPAPELKRQYPNWDVQLRSLEIYFPDDPARPGLEVDFWVKFDRSGDFAIRPGRFAFRVNGAQGEHLGLQFVEDQLLNMNRKIYAAFDQEFAAFQQDEGVLSLERYGPIGRQLMLVEAKWKALIS